MIKTSVIIKAKKMHFAGSITFSGDSRTKSYYVVKDSDSFKEHEVVIEKTDESIVLTCTCTNKSLHVDKPNLCSHQIAVLLFESGKVNLNKILRDAK